MTARRVLGRLMVAAALLAVVLLSTGAVASAQGIDPFQPKPIAAGSGGSGDSGSGGTSSTTPTTTSSSSGSGSGGTSAGTSSSSTSASSGTQSGAGTGTPSAPASSSSATTGSGNGLAFTGAHTMRIFVLGLITIFVGVPMVRAGRRWFDARHWPAC